jgi:hypothetical protein
MADPLILTAEELNSLPPGDKAQVKALYKLKQALFDILGSYPQDNVLPYFYSFNNTVLSGNPVAANATVQNSIKITADAAFVAMDVRAVVNGDFLLFMRTDSSDRQLMNQPVQSSILCGTGQRPAPLRKPFLIPANTTLSFDITDLSGAQNEIRLTLAGFKVYNRKIQ